VAILYEHANYGGRWTAFGADDADFGNDEIWHDRASSIRIRTVPQCSGDGIYLYEHSNYSGRCRKFTGNYADLKDTGFNDLASSVRLVGSYGGGQYKVTLCEHANYGGTCSSFTSDDNDLGNNAIRHDRTSSVKIDTTSSRDYYLPWPAGQDLYVIQDNNRKPTHEGKLQYAWDFSEDERGTKEGHPIAAVADGTVVVRKDSTSWGWYVVIEHSEPDGTPKYSLYAHLREIDANVREGESICRGALIGRIGRTGQIIGNAAHLHFQFMDAIWEGQHSAPSVPGSFNEVGGDGVPRHHEWYQSQNTSPSSYPCPTDQYRAQYYDNRSLSGNPTFTRCENPPINYDWGIGRPGNGVGNDRFSVRWTGRFNFSSGNYTFIAKADDGIRVYIDGTRIINAWWDQVPTEYRANRSLSSGEHEVKVEYYENEGGALVQVRWERADLTCPTDQYRAQYYDNRSLSGSPTTPANPHHALRQ